MLQRSTGQLQSQPDLKQLSAESRWDHFSATDLPDDVGGAPLRSDMMFYTANRQVSAFADEAPRRVC